jgi:hypothetical protein
MAATQITAPDQPGRSPKISRNRTVSTKLTELEFAEAERAAAARGQWLSEWVRDVIVREVRMESEERIAEHAFTELVGLQLLLMNVLQPLLLGQKISGEQFQKLVEQIQATKQNKARELLTRRGLKEEQSNVQHL